MEWIESVDIRNIYKVVSGQIVDVCYVHDLSNKPLILAAPDLLAACQEFLSAGWGSLEQDKAIAQIMAAVAKAKGEGNEQEQG